MVETETKRYLKDVKQDGENFVISHVVEIEKEIEEVISGGDLMAKINVLEGEVNLKTAEYNEIADELNDLTEEYNKYQEIAVNAGLIELEEDDDEDEESEEESRE